MFVFLVTGHLNYYVFWLFLINNLALKATNKMINASNDNIPQVTNSNSNAVTSAPMNVATSAQPVNQAQGMQNPMNNVRNINSMPMTPITMTTPNIASQRVNVMTGVGNTAKPMDSVTSPTATPPAFGGGTDSAMGSKPKKKFNVKLVTALVVLIMLFVGAGSAFFLSQQSQDLRQQASFNHDLMRPCDPMATEGSPLRCSDTTVCADDDGDGAWYCQAATDAPGVGEPCDIVSNLCAGDLVCHCQDGNACTDMRCETRDENYDSCLKQGRSWCINQGGLANTCCVEGYTCGENRLGCYFTGSPTPKPPGSDEPTTPPNTPPALVCNSTCSTNTECSSINSAWTCDATSNKCRLAANPTSTTCQPAAALTCNESCTTNAQCSGVNPNWTCDATSNKCRLAANPTSTTCQPAVPLTCNEACTTDTQCSSVNAAWTCDDTSNKCRLASNLTSTTCAEAVPLTCNDSCTYASECSSVNPDWTCDTTANKCRLETNPTSTTCEEAVPLTCNETCTDSIQCSSVNPDWTCDAQSNKCRLETNPTSTTCAEAVPLTCNETCTADIQCSSVNSAWTCDETSEKCRLASNPVSTTCEAEVIPGCNDACTTDLQCSGVNAGWTCDDTSNKCRLASNLTSTTCEPEVVLNEPMCKDVAILDENNNVLNPNSSTFSIGMILKFRCAADDVDNQVTNYEFKVTEPDGTVVEGSAINPAGSSATSQAYQINQYLSHQVQCRVCTGDACQDWIEVSN
ncbi:hypothetical protein KA111_01980 [Candidatus Woesebacteria bacterium]|nr:hypothetical protein [Candidatus Woesebacteria bacterium]